MLSREPWSLIKPRKRARFPDCMLDQQLHYDLVRVIRGKWRFRSANYRVTIKAYLNGNGGRPILLRLKQLLVNLLCGQSQTCRPICGKMSFLQTGSGSIASHERMTGQAMLYAPVEKEGRAVGSASSPSQG